MQPLIEKQQGGKRRKKSNHLPSQRGEGSAKLKVSFNEGRETEKSCYQ